MEAATAEQRERRRALVYPDQLEKIRERVERVAVKARRYGCVVPTLRSVDRRGDQIEIEISGALPHLDGYEPVARLHHSQNPDLQNRVELLKKDAKAQPEWLGATPRCEHCGVRRRRSSTVILHHPAGAWIQVGNSCVRDFSDSGDPEVLLRLAERQIDAAHRGQVPPLPYPLDSPLLDYLAAVCAVAGGEGFVTVRRARAEGLVSTAEQAQRQLLEGGEDEPSRAHADEIERWVLNDLAEKPEKSRYEEALVAIFRAVTHVGETSRGLVASGYIAYERAQRRRDEEHYVGTVGKFATVVCRVIFQAQSERATRHGPMIWHEFEDSEGRRIAWSATGRRLEVGSEVVLRGEVVRHTTFKGKPVTVLRRCQVKAVADRPTPIRAGSSAPTPARAGQRRGSPR